VPHFRDREISCKRIPHHCLSPLFEGAGIEAQKMNNGRLALARRWVAEGQNTTSFEFGRQRYFAWITICCITLLLYHHPHSSPAQHHARSSFQYHPNSASN
jgi:hypothetical protein